MAFLDGIKLFCFGASYSVALALELLQLFWPRKVQRYAALAFGAVGLLAHSAYLLWHPPNLAEPFGSLLLLAWVLAVFYLYGAIHHGKTAWAVFVLPPVIALVALAALPRSDGDPARWAGWSDLAGDRFWGAVHGTLLFLAAVGVSVGFVASVMYLVQQRRLRAKLPPARGLRLLSLERLEAMNRRAVNLAFPFLTVGLVVGAVLLARQPVPVSSWGSAKVVGTVVLWLVAVLLLYLRYGTHVPGRRLAVLTIVAFVLLLATLAAAHPGPAFAPGGPA
jgi:hypothetical protein